ncbi:MAG: hypothetical protein DMF69_19015, partial [Acidobacteria bacterium]
MSICDPLGEARSTCYWQTVTIPDFYWQDISSEEVLSHRKVEINMKIFVADDVSESGLQPLREAAFNVEKRTGLSREELAGALKDCEGLIVRSETKVTADLLDSATSLRVIGRAGVGVDNIDVAAATMRGMVVMNAPDGNTITTAEHTIALLIS